MRYLHDSIIASNRGATKIVRLVLLLHEDGTGPNRTRAPSLVAVGFGLEFSCSSYRPVLTTVIVGTYGGCWGRGWDISLRAPAHLDSVLIYERP